MANRACSDTDMVWCLELRGRSSVDRRSGPTSKYKYHINNFNLLINHIYLNSTFVTSGKVVLISGV